MVISIPTLLAHTIWDAASPASFYIYDNTYQEEEPVFLGGHRAHPGPAGVLAFTGLPEISLEELEDASQTHKWSRFELRELDIADRKWSVAVVSLPNTYKPEFGIAIFGGVMILLASVILSTCVWADIHRVSKMNAIRAQANQEKADIILQTARQQALAERELNDYIAHEVRDPLSSAIAALSFVSAATKEPNHTEEEKQVLNDDLHSIDSRLSM